MDDRAFSPRQPTGAQTYFTGAWGNPMPRKAKRQALLTPAHIFLLILCASLFSALVYFDPIGAAAGYAVEAAQ